MEPAYTVEELAEAIAKALAPHLTQPDPDQLFDHADLARLFKVSRSTIFTRAKQENWPRTRLGSTDRFSRADIEAIKQLHHKEPVTKTVPSVGTRANRRKK